MPFVRRTCVLWCRIFYSVVVAFGLLSRNYLFHCCTVGSSSFLGDVLFRRFGPSIELSYCFVVPRLCPHKYLQTCSETLHNVHFETKLISLYILSSVILLSQICSTVQTRHVVGACCVDGSYMYIFMLSYICTKYIFNKSIIKFFVTSRY